MEKTPFMNSAEVVEWTLVTHGLIVAFEQRGYGLYKLGRGPMMFSGIEMIMEFVGYGRAEEVLEVNWRYLPLPLIKDSKDTFQMQKAIEEMVYQLRGPFFTNILVDKEGEPAKTRSHLIDSISVEPPFLNLYCDIRFCQMTTENTIEIHLSGAAEVIRRQFSMSLRHVSAQTKGGKPNALL
jgi:hypothetical protein